MLERSPLAQLTLSRVRAFAREPEAVFWTFFFPVLLALALGIAFREGRGDRLVVAIEAGARADSIAAAIAAGPRPVDVRVLERADADVALREGEVALVVGAGDSLTYRFDESRADARLARLVVDDALQRAAGRTDPRVTRDVLVEERGARYIDFLIPGLLGLNLLSTGLWGVAYSLVRMREGKLLKRFAATPMRRSDFLLSFMLGRLAFLAAELAILLVFAWLVFDVVVRGSLASFTAVAVLGAFMFTALGLLVASRSRTTEGVSGLMNVVGMPMWILSGVFFSYKVFPEVVHPLIRALPLTALNDALRAIMNDGAPLLSTWPELAIMTGWGAACFAGALAVFRWR